MSTAIRHLPVQVARTRTHLRLFAKTTTGTASIRYLSTGRLAPNSLFTRVSKATHPITVSIHAKSAKLGSSFSTSTSTANMGEIKQFVDGKIAENKVMVFGKSYCPYCHKAKKIVQDATEEYEYIDIDLRQDGSEIQAYLKQLNGQGTVPHVYINQDFIGGCSDLQAIPASKLKSKIAGQAA